MISTRAGVPLDSATYHVDSETYRFEYDLDETDPSMAVVAALSEVEGAEPTTLEPLNDTVDADALDTLLRVQGTATGDVRVSWTYGEYGLTVHSYGMVVVRCSEADGPDDSTGDAADE